jgi:hypothetical protein
VHSELLAVSEVIGTRLRQLRVAHDVAVVGGTVVLSLAVIVTRSAAVEVHRCGGSVSAQVTNNIGLRVVQLVNVFSALVTADGDLSDAVESVPQTCHRKCQTCVSRNELRRRAENLPML